MTAQTNMELIQAWVDAVNRNDVQAELACWQPDGEFEVVATGTIYKGLAELERAGGVSAALDRSRLGSASSRTCVMARWTAPREYFDSGVIARQLGLDSATVAAMYSSLGAEARSQSG